MKKRTYLLFLVILTINQELTLSVWLVDPALDPHAAESNLAENNQRALRRGLSVTNQIIGQIPCVSKLFENINPMIADRLFQSWYLDIIPIRLFPKTQNQTDDELIAVLQGSGFEFTPLRRKPMPAEVSSPPADACTWPEARAAIQHQLGSQSRNATAYLLVYVAQDAFAQYDPTYNEIAPVVYAQWDIHDPAETQDSVILENLNHLAESVTCLWPPVERLEVFVVDQSGQLVAYIIVPGLLIREQVLPLPPDGIILHHVSPVKKP